MKKRGGDEDCGSWMDTYGDMVTLLLCFFVLLYSMSALDMEKFKIFVRSINPNVSDEQVGINQPEGEYGIEDEIRLDPDDPIVEDEVELLNMLYEELVEAMEEAGAEGVTISGGDGYAYISFQDSAFFEGDSSALNDRTKEILSRFCTVIEPMSDSIARVCVMAHTAQADPNKPNNPINDRQLSALRGANVAAFIQTTEAIETVKVVGMSYGQFHPIASNDTAEGRARNRRVEILLLEEGVDLRELNEYYAEMQESGNIVTIGGGMQEGFDVLPDSDVPPAAGVSTVEPTAEDGSESGESGGDAASSQPDAGSSPEADSASSSEAASDPLPTNATE